MDKSNNIENKLSYTETNIETKDKKSKKKDNVEKIDFIMGCPSFNCSNGRKSFRWKHSCGGEEWLDENGYIECKKCNSKCLLTESKFKCSGHSDARNINKDKICEILCISPLERASLKFKEKILIRIGCLISCDSDDEINNNDTIKNNNVDFISFA